MSLDSPLARLLAFALFAVLLTAACKAPGTSPVPSPTTTVPPKASPTSTTAPGIVAAFASVSVSAQAEGHLTRLEIVPDHPVVSAGDTIAFYVLAYDERGKPISLDELDVQWHSTDPLAGKVTPTGIFTAGAQRGVFDRSVQVIVSQTVEGKAVSLERLTSVSVIRPLTENDIARLEVLPNILQLEPNASATLSPLAVDRTGVPVTGVEYTWVMLNPLAGSVSEDGRFTSGTIEGVYPGAIRVVAAKRGDLTQTASAVISVTVQRLGGVGDPIKVNVFPQSISVRPGGNVAFRAIALDSRGNLVSNVTTGWSVRDPRVGTLDVQGRLTAGQTPGVYTSVVEVTVTDLDGKVFPLTARATVTVLTALAPQEKLQNIILAPQVLRLRPGESRRIIATALTNSGQTATGLLTSWTSRSPAVQVDKDGLVTALDQPGTYADAVSVSITAQVDDQVVTRSASATVIILGPLSRVEVVPRDVSVTPKQAVQFSFIAYDSNGLRLFDVIARWEVTDPRAGAIDNFGFFVTSALPGNYPNAIRVTVTPLVVAGRTG